jgi:hypothetical protein
MTPDVERLCARLAELPAVFSGPFGSAAEAERGIEPLAILSDLFRERANDLPPREAIAGLTKAKGKGAKQRVELALIASWVLYDPSLAGADAGALLRLLGERLPALAEIAVPRLFVEDPERREELVRLCLDALGLVPAGETRAQAEDRLASLDSLRRHELLRAARDRELSRRAEELARLRAEEEEARRQAARTTFED